MNKLICRYIFKKPRIYLQYYPKLKYGIYKVSELPKYRVLSTIEHYRWQKAYHYAHKLNTTRVIYHPQYITPHKLHCSEN